MASVGFRIDANCDCWETAKYWIDDACRNGDGFWTTETLRDLLCEGRAALWVLEDSGTPIGVAVSAVGNGVAEILAAGGSGIIENMNTGLPKIEEWARGLGASEVILRGRRGWSRVYKSHGYEEIAVTMRKAL